MKAKEELKELKLKSVNDLTRLLALNQEKLRDLRFKVSQNQLKNIRELRAVRKKVSRIITLIDQKNEAIVEKKIVDKKEIKKDEKEVTLKEQVNKKDKKTLKGQDKK